MIEQMIVNGLLAGFIYIIMALGFTLIFGIMRIVNFAHGEFYMAGAVVVLFLFGALGWNFFLAVVIAGFLAAALGIVIERVLFRPLVGNELPGMIMSLAVGITLQSIALILFGPSEQSVQRPFSGTWQLVNAVVPWDRTVVAIAALVILAAFYLFLKHSRLGLAMQAVAQDRETSSLMGVESGLIYASAFGIACALAGLAGGLMAPIYTIGPYMGELPMLKAFVVVILGGLGSVPGAVLGGLLIGLSESVLSTLFSSTTALIASFTIVLLIVVMRPTGLLGRGAP
ncbi:MAG: branched-chain amino acid ABC transporter permease [Chelatococcus sp.]|uniref:branched-chain amino acid ABC transporter permease n=1 Tax=unclassified Chelatococcus TaxID=2638111 RepID=UPI001BCAD471|nr:MULTISPECIES: branched-chain amino acid ABC transporter permease [unclassified Chelatococcus]CAH1648279.1 High-affinity branched-chain amino acid transport system permease protein LivH (TC 3.A.1.4.1) [Hyphomicrobiales bacterium]MBS7742010.1 branched-chain amino acid ABC transporter permease [Chelatococcus sp. HY11]MBX3539983.1 branched-chain amino acid ABC transporter permease [Chelatococcus sp.]MBX3541192.1 branched-chain amino acid ABC transporter permease [Chelatococcus sp.]MCO5074915.1 